MAQVTIYLDDQTRKAIERRARGEHVSVSRWIKQRLEDSLRSEWPVGYEKLFGSLKGADLERPVQPSLRNDAPREEM